MNEGPQLRRPAVPDEALRGPPLPSLQLALPGSQFGFSGPTSNAESTTQVPAHATNSVLTWSSQINQGSIQPSNGHAFGKGARLFVIFLATELPVRPYELCSSTSRTYCFSCPKCEPKSAYPGHCNCSQLCPVSIQFPTRY